jgi:hypothetical protein
VLSDFSIGPDRLPRSSPLWCLTALAETVPGSRARHLEWVGLLLLVELGPAACHSLEH